MAEYNIKYQDLKKRLRVLGLLNDSDCSINSSNKEERKKQIDSLLKNLDYKHSEELPLTDIEASVIELEKR